MTRKAHERNEAILANQHSRKDKYYVLVFKPETMLDNSIFSTNNFDVVRNTNGMKVDANDNGIQNDFGRKLNFMALWWQVAEAGGNRFRSSPPKAQANVSTLLD